MTKAKFKSKKPRSLSSGRPVALATHSSIPSSAETRSVIRRHHWLQKARAQASRANDHELADSLQLEIEREGGLATYQAASLVGQSKCRGGDTSIKLLDMVRPATGAPKLRLLDIGALSTETAVSRHEAFDVTRIDLSSQHRDILQQDFMERPLPNSPNEKMDIISLSLVLNFVPDVKQRGAMLVRLQEFLSTKTLPPELKALETTLPAVYLVLPAPCLLNSRYLTRAHFHKIMQSLGFRPVEEKITSKLYYSLWHWHGGRGITVSFPKQEINPGKSRNNFTIVLE